MARSEQPLLSASSFFILFTQPLCTVPTPHRDRAANVCLANGISRHCSTGGLSALVQVRVLSWNSLSSFGIDASLSVLELRRRREVTKVSTDPEITVTRFVWSRSRPGGPFLSSLPSVGLYDDVF